MTTAATLFDGSIAEAYPVDVSADGAAIIVTRPNGERDRIDPGLLELIEGPAGKPRFGRSDIAGWRLRFAAPPDTALADLLPQRTARYGRWVDRIGLLPAAGAFAIVAAAVVAIGYAAPAWIAPFIPEQWERDLGTALVGDFGDLRCDSPAGNRALTAMAERIEPGITTKAGGNAVRFTAIDINMFNAAALPGGHVVLFNQMLVETHADALAGVVAHEIAHVRRRHVTQALVRELGIGALIRLFAGGIGANAGQIVALSYTRANEEEADRDAIASLARADIDPRRTARLFDRLSKESGEGRGGLLEAEFLQSHPVSRDRARAFAASYDPARAYRPALPRAEADALGEICTGPQSSKNGTAPLVTRPVKRP